MLRYHFLVVAMCISCTAFAQLSKGEGKSISISDKKFSCYLPKYFEIQEEPPGVIHKASGTFVIAVKVPPGKNLSAAEGLQRSFFEDSRYEIIALTEEKGHKTHGPNTRTYFMRYRMKGVDFERYTTLVGHGHAQYLIIGNYAVKLKDQVVDEVRKVMESFSIR